MLFFRFEFKSYLLWTVVIGLVLLHTFSSAQQPIVRDLLDRREADETVYTVVERQPQFPGDMNALTDYMQKNVRYPEAAQKAKVTGRVFTSFIVERDGRLTDIKVLKGLGSGCDEEAIRVINTMPRWKPGTQSGIPIRVKYNLPITFGVPYPKIRE